MKVDLENSCWSDKRQSNEERSRKEKVGKRRYKKVLINKSEKIVTKGGTRIENQIKS